MLKNFNALGQGLRLDGMQRDLDHGELLCIAYYQAVIQHLVKTGVLPNTANNDIMFITADSFVQEDDYE